MGTSSSAELKAFDAAARAGSMSAAARMLGVSQPTISAHVASLEQRFGVELFHRRGRGVVLTEFGALLHEATHRITRAEEQAEQLLLSARSQYQGHLRIGAIGPYNVTPVIRRFRAAYPRVQVSVSMGDSRAVVQGVRDQQQDVGLLLHAVDDAHVHCLPYRRQPLVVLAPRTHPLASRTQVALADLEGMEFVLREHGSGTRAVFEAGLATAGVKVRCSLVMGSREGVKEAVAQGLGLGVVASTAHAPDRRVLALPLREDLATHVHVICLRERLQASLIARFLQVVQAEREGLSSEESPASTAPAGSPGAPTAPPSRTPARVPRS
jgi:aminoethylphosphonate catabolism LysR family transcriptional regulator